MLAQFGFPILDNLIVAIGPVALVIAFRDKGGTATWVPTRPGELLLVDLAAIGAIVLAMLWCRATLDGIGTSGLKRGKANQSLRTFFRIYRKNAAESRQKRLQAARPRFWAAVGVLFLFLIARGTLVERISISAEDHAFYEKEGYLDHLPWGMRISEEPNGSWSGTALTPLFMTSETALYAASDHGESQLPWWTFQLQERGRFSEGIDSLSGSERHGVLASSILLASLFVLLVHLATAVYGIVTTPSLRIFESASEFFGWLE